MKLHRDLNVTQETAWFLAQRIRESFATDGSLPQLPGPVEVDESNFGRNRKNMSNAKRKQLVDEGAGRGTVGKTAIVGVKDRETKEVRVGFVQAVDKKTLHDFIAEHTEDDATVYTDGAQAYEELPLEHEAVKHSVAEYVRGMTHTNGVESFWSMLKRAHKGTFHKLSPKHLDRYVQELTAKHNIRPNDTMVPMGCIVHELEAMTLTYSKPKKGNALSSSAKA